eukprot:m.944709 g.944709  ORF g.944709 m.944709 type:complete len:129 (+) comp23843_c0_seq41:3533-3919(+)
MVVLPCGLHAPCMSGRTRGTAGGVCSIVHSAEHHLWQSGVHGEMGTAHAHTSPPAVSIRVPSFRKDTARADPFILTWPTLCLVWLDTNTTSPSSPALAVAGNMDIALEWVPPHAHDHNVRTCQTLAHT